MNNILDVILVFLAIVNLCLHSTGCYLLICLYQNGNQKLQQIYLINFSCCEIVMNCVQLVCCTLEMISTSPNTNELRKYLDIVNLAGNGTVYYLSISYINLDRFFDILLNIRYPVYWSEQKSKYLISCTWFVGIFVAVIFSLLYKLKATDYYHVLFTYFFPTLNSVFLIIAVFAYSYIFHKYKQTRPLPTHKIRRRGVTDKPSLNQVAIYRNSRFHIPVLIVISFVVLKVLPDLTAEIFIFGDVNDVDMMLNICFVSYAFAGIASAYIYVFVQKPIRALLCKKVRATRSLWNLRKAKRVRKRVVFVIPLRDISIDM